MSYVDYRDYRGESSSDEGGDGDGDCDGDGPFNRIRGILRQAQGPVGEVVEGIPPRQDQRFGVDAQRSVQPAHASLDDGEADAKARIEAYINELEDEAAMLRVQLDGRDDAIKNFEHTVDIQGETIQELQYELDELKGQAGSGNRALEEEIEALRAEMEGMHAESCRVEAIFQEETRQLRSRVHKKKKLVVDLTNKLKECQSYIAELTDELEKVYKRRDGVRRNATEVEPPIRL